MRFRVANFLRLRGDSGAALVMVIVMGAVMTMIVATAVAVSVAGMKSSRTNESWNAALAAAYAGVEEYRNRLANDSTYSKYGNPASALSIATGSVVALPTAPVNPAFGVGAAGDWATVPGSNGVAKFRYEVDNANYTSKGILSIRSTGKVGNSTRSVVANLKQKGFIDFLYFTDFEVQDPDNGGAACTPTYAWASVNSCTQISFLKNDVIDGPVHSNDSLRLCGKFFGTVTTSKPTSPFYTTSSSCGAGNLIFSKGTPTSAQSIGMPPTNAEMLRETRSDLPNEVPRPGCLYTGPTVIKLLNTGKMNVKSPYTKFTTVAGDPAAVGTDSSVRCGKAGNVTGGLGSPAGATIDVPAENLIYVQNVPSVPSDPAAAKDPNATADLTYPTGFTCTNAASGGFTSWASSSTNVVRFPRTSENFVPAASTAHYGCRNGDAYVEGTLKGALTIAAQNYVYATGDITYADAARDILGLVGNNGVVVWNPMKVINGDYTPLLSGSDRTISAAILSVVHTFMVQNYGVGGYRGKLTVTGAIAQKFRGPVGMSSSGVITEGYAKNYLYDPRLRETAPPKFLSPVSTTYGISQVGAVGAAFKADGSAG